MSIVKNLKIWDDLQGTTNSYHDEDNNFIVELIMNGEVKGHYKTIPGQGIEWSLPDELVDPAVLCNYDKFGNKIPPFDWSTLK